jgi:hypothetical protein
MLPTQIHDDGVFFLSNNAGDGVEWNLLGLHAGHLRRVVADIKEPEDLISVPNSRDLLLSGRYRGRRGLWLVDSDSGRIDQVVDDCVRNIAISPDARVAFVVGASDGDRIQYADLH